MNKTRPCEMLELFSPKEKWQNEEVSIYFNLYLKFHKIIIKWMRYNNIYKYF